MFKEFFLQEIGVAIKRPMVWIFFSMTTLMVFAAVASDNVVIGGSVGNIYKNAPHIITIYTVILSLFGLLIAAAFFNNAALRDYNYKFNEILFSTPLQKSSYFFGRFMGAWVLSMIPLLGIFLGFILGATIAPAMGWIDSDRIGDFYLSSFINNFFLFILPNMFFGGAVIFAIANKWKSSVISFVGVLLIIIGYSLSGQIISNIDNETIAGLVDTFGIRAYSIDTKYATSAEKNTIGATFSGVLILNRILWMFIGSLVLALSYWSFSFAEKHKKAKLDKKKLATPKPAEAILAPTLNAIFNNNTSLQHFISFFKIDFYSIIRSATFKTLFIFSAVMLFVTFINGFEYFGLQSYPVTYKMIDSLRGATGLFELIILVFFSGELVWRDRASKISEVVDATPHNSVISLLAKVTALICTVSIIHLFGNVIAILYQLGNGYTNIELGVYLQTLMYDTLPRFIFLSLFLVFIQILIDNKYVAYFVSILVLLLKGLFLSIFEIQTNMLNIGAKPFYKYSDMNEFGAAITGVHWFNLYWLLFATVLLGFSGLIWVRGKTSGFKNRVKSFKKHLTRKYAIGLGCIAALWFFTASFVYYNTKIINSYKGSTAREKMQVNYEKTYKKYQNIAQPKLTDTKYIIDVFPEERKVLATSEMILENKSHTAIDSIHCILDDDWNMKVTIPNSELVFEDKDLGYMIYKLNQPLAPHASMKMTAEASYVTQGFENEVRNTSIAKNGTFINNMSILPIIGYSDGYEISDKNTRKKYDLKPKKQMAELESPCSHHCMQNYLSDGRADWVNVETVISTSSDQVAIAPGSLVKEWEKDGRKYFNYKVDRPSQNFFSFMSARYEVARKKWNGIDIEVYYDKQHSYNVEKMLTAVENSLKYYTKNFGPYFHKQARIIEFPRYSTFAQAFPGTMPYSESIGFIINLENESDINFVNAVIAHEMAHQWWAHQVIGSSMEGSTMLSESFAEYSSLMVMKTGLNDDIQMKEFLKHDFERYLKGRSRETRKESPLYKVQNQGYIHYGKGSVILYALQDYIGQDSVNNTLKDFLEAYRYQEPPYPTSMDFLKFLEPRVPDSLKYLINDWFKEITLYDYRLKEASFKKLENGKYQVDMEIEAHKMRVDSIGNETEIDFKDWVDIGVYSDDAEKQLIYIKRVLLDKENMKFTVEVDELPAKAAIDPKRLLIERNIGDNVKSL
jgi:ABC-2 type transport system permease protein